MDRLELELELTRRDLRLALSLGVGAETVALVGPSGAGKSTLLRAIAGLETPDRGRIVLDGHVLFDAGNGIDLPPQQRRIGLVFQDLALFPHMTVAQNVAFGGRGGEGLLERFAIAHLADERPGRLSGGERQRVALARTLAADPRLLLLDEPFSALDSDTRHTVRSELADLLAALDVPTLMVTHDFDDAVGVAQRIGVITAGRLRQIGTPSDLVAAPADAFVARFAGLNMVAGVAEQAASGLTVVTLDDGQRVWSTDRAVGEVAVAIAPWEISVGRESGGDSALNCIEGVVRSLVRFDNRARVQIGSLVAEITGAAVEGLSLAVGDRAVATFKATATRLVAR